MKEQFMAETAQRLRDIFDALARGEDVSPARRYRAEGFMQAGVYLGLATEQQLSGLLAKLQVEIMGFEEQGTLVPLEIPVPMKRAPVVPSN